MDSLGLVNLIIAIEQRLTEDLGVSVSLADRGLIFRKNGPLRTVATLADYIYDILKKRDEK